MQTIATMLGMSILAMATRTTTIRTITIMFGVCGRVKMFSFKNIHKCYLECKKNKSTKRNTLEFEADLLENLWKLHDELNHKTYRVGKSLCFLTHSPKLREVFAADFKDRIVHHILVKEIEDFYERRFISDVYNNRKEKGIHKGAKKAQSYMQRYPNGYYLQLDIKGFFYNIDKNILYKFLLEDISKSDLKTKNEILWLANKIIYHKPQLNFTFKGDINKLHSLPAHKTLFKIPLSKGLAIGNLTSQFFANVYMNRFDNYVKRTLKMKSYIRYVDDFVLFESSKEKLQDVKRGIENYLKNELFLELRADSRLRENKDGVDFLGYVIRPNYILVRQRVVNNFKCNKARFYEYYENGGDRVLAPILKYNERVASFRAHIKHANSYKLNLNVGVA